MMDGPVDQIQTFNVKGVAHSVKPKNNDLTLPFSSLPYGAFYRLLALCFGPRLLRVLALSKVGDQLVRIVEHLAARLPDIFSQEQG